MRGRARSGQRGLGCVGDSLLPRWYETRDGCMYVYALHCIGYAQECACGVWCKVCYNCIV